MVGWILGVRWPPLLPQSIFLFVCSFVSLFAVFLYYRFECLHVSDLFHVNMDKQHHHPFCRGSSLFFEFNNFCQAFHGGYWPPGSSFHIAGHFWKYEGMYDQYMWLHLQVKKQTTTTDMFKRCFIMWYDDSLHANNVCMEGIHALSNNLTFWYLYTEDRCYSIFG